MQGMLPVSYVFEATYFNMLGREWVRRRCLLFYRSVPICYPSLQRLSILGANSQFTPLQPRSYPRIEHFIAGPTYWIGERISGFMCWRRAARFHSVGNLVTFTWACSRLTASPSAYLHWNSPFVEVFTLGGYGVTPRVVDR